jgi:hypothetical protein
VDRWRVWVSTDNQRLIHTTYSYISFQAFYRRHLLIKVDPIRNRGFFFSILFYWKFCDFFQKFSKTSQIHSRKNKFHFCRKKIKFVRKKTLIRNGWLLNTLLTTFFTQMSVWWVQDMDADLWGIQFFSCICNTTQSLKLSLRRKLCK